MGRGPRLGVAETGSRTADNKDFAQLLRILAASPDPEQAQLARDDRLVGRMLERVRNEGCGTNDGEWKVEPHVGGIAVPLVFGGKVLASLSVVYLVRALSVTEATKRFLPVLSATAQKIQESFGAPGGSGAVGSGGHGRGLLRWRFWRCFRCFLPAAPGPQRGRSTTGSFAPPEMWCWPMC